MLGYDPTETLWYHTESLGRLIVKRDYDALHAGDRFVFYHKGLDLTVERFVSVRTLNDMRGVDVVSVFGAQAESEMLKMLRDKINPPPQPAPKPLYGIQHSALGRQNYFSEAYPGSGASWSWRANIDSALLFSTPEAAIRRLSASLVEHGAPFNGNVSVVRIDVRTSTSTERVVTVLK